MFKVFLLLKCKLNSLFLIMYSGMQMKLPSDRFLKSDVSLGWLIIRSSSMPHLKDLTANCKGPF